MAYDSCTRCAYSLPAGSALLRKFSSLGFKVAWPPIEDMLDGAKQGVLVAIERGKL